MQIPLEEEVSSMCYERYPRRRREESDESRELWEEFERTRPLAGPEPPAEVTEAESTETAEELASSER